MSPSRDKPVSARGSSASSDLNDELRSFKLFIVLLNYFLSY